MDSTITIIILIAIGVFVGFAAGLLISEMRSNRKELPSSPKRAPANRAPQSRSIEDKIRPEPMDVAAPPQHITSQDNPPLPTEEPLKQPSMNPVNILARAVRAEVKSPGKSPKSIVAQVDDILQERLADTPMGKKGISLQETPAGGMVIQVGMNKYEGIDAVPEAEIRQAIRSAVSEWENQLEEEV